MTQITSNWTSPLTISITTKALTLRSIQEDDTDRCMLVFGDADLMKSYCEQATRKAQAVAEYVKKRSALFEQNVPFSTFVIFERATNSYVGLADIAYSEGAAEIGYILHKDHHGKGYGYEAAHALVFDYLTEITSKGYVSKVDRVFATVLPQNKPSIRILEKLGMAYVKDVECYNTTRHLYELRLKTP